MNRISIIPKFLTILCASWASLAKPAPATAAHSELVRLEGDPLPVAGQAGIDASATWTDFGQPAINDAGQVAFRGRWRPLSGTGIFLDNTLLAKVGDTVPGLPGATFKRLYDPVVDNLGHVAFLATIEGDGVTAATEQVVVSNGRTGALEILARTGNFAPGSNTAVYRNFESVSIQAASAGGTTSGTLFLATLLPRSGSPAVTTASDTGAWWLPAGGTDVQLLVREGDPGFAPKERIKTFRILKSIDGSPGQGRGQANGNQVFLQLGLTTNRHALALATPGELERITQSGQKLGSTTLTKAVWYKLGLPCSDDQGVNVSLFGTLRVAVGGVKRAAVRGIFASTNSGTNWNPVVRTSGAAPGFERVTFLAFSEPVNSATDAGLAFHATLRGRGITASNNDGLWWKPANGALTLLAREGSQPPGAPIGARWRLFNSFVLPGGSVGPIFTATLSRNAGGITDADDFGLYAADANGVVQELVRENQPLLGLTVKTFTVLRAVVGVEGSSRAFNATSSVALLVTFTNQKTAIVKVSLDVPK